MEWEEKWEWLEGGDMREAEGRKKKGQSDLILYWECRKIIYGHWKFKVK